MTSYYFLLRLSAQLIEIELPAEPSGLIGDFSNELRFVPTSLSS
jgi:hypothetical protein